MYNNSFEKVVMLKSIYVYFQHDYSFYYIHYEIASDPCNLIGYHSCDLFMNHTISCSKCISFLTNETALLKNNHQSHFKAYLKKLIKLQENERQVL